MTKLLRSGIPFGRAWSQIQSLFITTFNLKHNCDTILTIICYEKVIKGRRFPYAFNDHAAICQKGDHAHASTIVNQHLLSDL
jgi:hypothetical protein